MKRSIYILHITYEDGAIDHYLGSTQRGRFNARMAEHRHRFKKMSRTTPTNRATTIEGFVVRTNQTLQDEQFMQLTENWRDLCPLCNPPPATPQKPDATEEPRSHPHS